MRVPGPTDPAILARAIRLQALTVQTAADEAAAVPKVDPAAAISAETNEPREGRVPEQVYAALQPTLLRGAGVSEAEWRRFGQALPRETGLDARLLGKPAAAVEEPARASRMWLIGVAAVLVVALYALFS